MVTKIELLVHAGASTTRADDDAYRVQAESYLLARYNVSSRWPLEGDARGDQATVRPDMPSNRIMATHPDSTNMPHDTTVFVEDTQLAYTALESQIVPSSQLPRFSQTSFNGPVEHQQARTPPKRLLSMGDGETPSTEPIDSQSSYLRTPLPHQSSKKRRVERISDPPRHIETAYTPAAREHSIKCSFVGASTSRSAHDISLGLLVEENTVNEATSQLPSSYSLSDVTPGSSGFRPRASQRSTSDPGLHSPSTSRPAVVLRSSTYPSVVSSNDVATIRGQQRPNDESAALPISLQATKAKTSDPRCTSAQKPGSVDEGYLRTNTHGTKDDEAGINVVEDQATKLKNLPLFIRPPEPLISIDEFTTHITPLLDRLAGLEVARAYKPVSVAREIQVWERGHWLIDASSLGTDLQLNLWQKLQEYIGVGSCGWGVWCTRDLSRLSPTKETLLGTVRVFCWGEVVQHIYLLLYTVSMSKIRSLGLQWIDAEEVVGRDKCTGELAAIPGFATINKTFVRRPTMTTGRCGRSAPELGTKYLATAPIARIDSPTGSLVNPRSGI
nr:hypothetical protein CFP56_22454 [Quercus suber]